MKTLCTASPPPSNKTPLIRLPEPSFPQLKRAVWIFPPHKNAQTVVGAGITAEVEGVGLVKAGKAEFAELTLPKFSDGVWDIASIVAVSVDNKPIGAFALADALKADTAEAIGRLKNTISMFTS